MDGRNHMNNRSIVFEIATAYLLEAFTDYETVPILIAHEKYNLAVYHAQQTVEKLLKLIVTGAR